MKNKGFSEGKHNQYNEKKNELMFSFFFVWFHVRFLSIVVIELFIIEIKYRKQDFDTRFKHFFC